MTPNHISLVREDPILQTLRSHPFDRQFHCKPLSLPEVVPGIHILRETKVCYLDHEMGIKPTPHININITMQCIATSYILF